MNPVARKALALLPDKLYLDLQFYKSFHRFPNWKAPKTFNEKIQWLKLYDRNPDYVSLVDKYKVKQIVADKIGVEHIIPTLGVWDRAEDIEWNKLPNRFVLKTTHGGGNNGVVVCKDKNTIDKAAVIEKLSEGLKHDSAAYGREWVYRDVKRRIIAEEFIDPSPEEKDLNDYKFFCFNGEPKMLFVGTERNNPNTETRFDFFDIDYNHLDILNGHPQADVVPAKPNNYDDMVEVARQLSKGYAFVRIDLYSYKGGVLFGEITFYHHSGMVPFIPNKWDDIMGAWIDLPKIKK